MGIHIWDIMDDTVVKTVRSVTKIGEKQSNSFANEQFVCLLHNLSRRIIFPLSRRRTRRPFQKTRRKWKFWRMTVLYYENQPWPPSLSQLGQLRGGQKADLALCLPSTSAEIATQPVADVVILDGTAVVQMLQPRTARTFDEYLITVYAPYILKHLETTRRADLVWDVYQDDSLKRSLREKRGSGQRHSILASKTIPAD